MQPLRWLHLTDFHQGVTTQSTLWPTIRSVFLNDLKAMQNRYPGPLDLLLFTGDLTQSGSPQQFVQLNELLHETLSQIEQLTGSRPVLLPVPGNHDLVRPSKDADVAIARDLYKWHGDETVRSKLWSGKAYLKLIEKAFNPYTAWMTEWRKKNPLPPDWTYHQGKLPGDFSLTVVKGGLQLGLVGLNSAFLQLQSGDYNGRVDVTTEQFHYACPPDGPTWCDRHHVNLLMTHHPPGWLPQAARDEHFYPDIHSPGRFLLHLFGHMHEARTTFLSQAADGVRRELQGASLYSREKWEGWTANPPDSMGETRIHGYSIGQIEWSGGPSAKLIIWPRTARKTDNQVWQFIPDYRLGLSNSPNQDSFSVDFPLNAAVPMGPSGTAGTPTATRDEKAMSTPQPPKLVLESLYEVMNQIFRTSSDWLAFCLDNYPAVKARLTEGDRRQQIFLLFELVGAEAVLQCIREEHGDALQRYSHLLRYRP